MADVLTYRGPDEGDVWCDDQTGLAFGHRRLSIIDLSPAGHQPMHSSSGRYVIVYNGEIYNAEELRPELKRAGKSFRGHSDTEIILEGCEVWGLRQTLERLAGMFAFALWDRVERRLSLVRDRVGIKPLYWAMVNRTLIFASELKALRAYPECPRAIDRDAVVAYLRHGYVPAPHTIYRGVHKLCPGQVLDLIDGSSDPTIDSFWTLDAAVRTAQSAPFSGSETEAVNELENLLRNIVKQHMISDVPLGAFLSGGIDSSTVVALMQAQSNRPVRSFTIGFAEEGYNEATHAAAVARHLGTDHQELYVTSCDALGTIPLMPDLYDEPFADSSQIPTYLVSKLTRQHVTVALSGDGGDELFGGYTRYLNADAYRRLTSFFPQPLRCVASTLIDSIPPATWDILGKAIPQHRRPSQLGDKLHKLASVLTEDGDGFYRRLVSQWWEPCRIAPNAHEPRGLIWDEAVKERIPNFVERMQYLDTLTYLPDDILVKIDRASMAVSLESRVPLLDHRLVEFAWRLPPSLKIRSGIGKWVLRQVLYRHVPRALVERPKTGFGIPLADWLRGPLREWAESLLSPAQLSSDGLLDPEPIRRCWEEHLSGRRNWQYPLWTVLMLQAWRERWT